MLACSQILLAKPCFQRVLSNHSFIHSVNHSVSRSGTSESISQCASQSVTSKLAIQSPVGQQFSNEVKNPIMHQGGSEPISQIVTRQSITSNPVNHSTRQSGGQVPLSQLTSQSPSQSARKVPSQLLSQSPVGLRGTQAVSHWVRYQ